MLVHKKRIISILLTLVMVFSMTVTANADTLPEDEGTDLLYEEIDTSTDEGVMPVGDLEDTYVNKNDSTYTSAVFKASSNEKDGNTIRVWFDNDHPTVGVKVSLYQYNGLFSSDTLKGGPLHITANDNDYFEYCSSNVYGGKFRVVIKSDSGGSIMGHLRVRQL